MYDLKISFSSKNGCCPYFIYKDTKFFIQDKRDYKNDWIYYLCSININTDIKEFESHELVLDYVKSIKNVRCEYSNYRTKRYLFATAEKTYAIENKILKIRNVEQILSREFGKYFDCLMFSKKYIEDYISKLEPLQLSFFAT